MRLHLSSASILALATAATLFLPLNAYAADFAMRKGRKVATSLDIPLDSANLNLAKITNAQLPITNATQINDATLESLATDGIFTNNGTLNQLTINGGGGINNHTGTIITATVNAGLLTNNGRIDEVNIASGRKVYRQSEQLSNKTDQLRYFQ